MNDWYDDVELMDEDTFVEVNQGMKSGTESKICVLDGASITDNARARLEKLLEEKRLRDELDDYLD